MTYQELINNIRDLGFSDNDEMEEFGELVPNSINRAITEINLNVAPILERYELEIGEDDTGYLYIDMTDVDDLFLDFADTPVLFEQEGKDYYQKFADYDIETNNTLVIDADKNKGNFRIFYKAEHDAFTGTDAQLREDLPLPRKVHHLVPLLAAYYIWLEDEPSKAAQYYNVFEQKSVEIQQQSQENSIKIRVLPGGM